MGNIKIGIFGVGRGMELVTDFLLNGFDIVAICDFHKDRREAAAKQLGNTTAVYEDFDEFLNHGLDAVYVANYFHEHAPYVIKCFQKGIHVFSECISNGTMAEGVELLRAFEQSNSIYMLCENYPQMCFNREIKRICDGGTLGKILYAQGEYNHPSDPKDAHIAKHYQYFEQHWRQYVPRTYYVTHSLGPIMWATGATPKRVTAFGMFAPPGENDPSASYAADRAAVLTTKNDDGSVFHFTGCSAFGANHNSYRVCGTIGQIENIRGMYNKVMLRYSWWATPEGAEDTKLYEPQWNDKDEEFIKKSGHDGGDFLTVRMFADCIRANKQPEMPFDIYSAVNMSSVAILGHRSMLDGGKPYDIPDFHDEECRKQYENDRETPFYGTDGSVPTIASCTKADYAPSEKQLKLYHELLES